MTGSIKPFNW